MTTAFGRSGAELADATLSGALDLRELDDQHDAGWTGICEDLAAEARGLPCADGVEACLDVTVGWLRGVAR